jgi:hypothetical protein
MCHRNESLVMQKRRFTSETLWYDKRQYAEAVALLGAYRFLLIILSRQLTEIYRWLISIN